MRDRKGVDLEDVEELRVGRGEMLIRVYYVKKSNFNKEQNM